jgi:predicted nucleic acid-binding protein
MRYVLDSCVAVKWVLPEADSQKALALRDDYLNGTHELIAPDVFKVEVAQAIRTAQLNAGPCVRRGLVWSQRSI